LKREKKERFWEEQFHTKKISPPLPLPLLPVIFLPGGLLGNDIEIVARVISSVIITSFWLVQPFGIVHNSFPQNSKTSMYGKLIN